MLLQRAFKVVDVLMVEDNPGDVRLTREALRRNGNDLRLHHAEDGISAMQFLRRDAPYDAAPRPDLILLDLNLPLMGGRDVLAAIKSDAALRSIPVIVLSTSQSDDDVAHAYDLQANCFITKPADLHEFNQVIRNIERFWLQTVCLTGRGGAT